MNWINIDNLAQLDSIYSGEETVVIFKHSTRCPVSSMAKRSLEFEKNLIPVGAKFYYLDLIANREISNKIAERWDVRHESPQILILKGQECLYNASHSDIEMQDIIKYIS